MSSRQYIRRSTEYILLKMMNRTVKFCSLNVTGSKDIPRQKLICYHFLFWQAIKKLVSMTSYNISLLQKIIR